MLHYDISIRKIESIRKEELIQQAEGFRIVANQTKRFVFRYNLQTDTYFQISNFTTQYNANPIVPNFSSEILNINIISDESRTAFINYFNTLKNIILPPKTDFKLIDINNEKHWIRFEATFVPDEKGLPKNAIISCFECSKQRESELAYSQWLQEIAKFNNENVKLFEWNLTKDILEKSSGDMKVGFDNFISKGFNEVTILYSNAKIFHDDILLFQNLVNSEKLLGMFHNHNINTNLEYREKTDDGSYRWMNVSIRLVMHPNSNEVIAYLLFENIDKQKREEIRNQKLIENDSLTGIYNRKTFELKVKEKIKTQNNDDYLYAILIIDLDVFKPINDTFGHAEGDKVLIEVAQTIASLLRKYDLVCRFGGDEFMIYLCDIPSKNVIQKKAQQICQLLHRPYKETFQLSASIGIALNPVDASTFEDLYKKADIAMYYVKEDGKNNFAFYNSDMKSHKK